MTPSHAQTNSLHFVAVCVMYQVREAVRAMQNRVQTLERAEQVKTARESAERERAERAAADAKLREVSMKLGGSTTADEDEWEEYEAEEDDPTASTTTGGDASSQPPLPPPKRKVIKRRRKVKPAAAAGTTESVNTASAAVMETVRAATASVGGGGGVSADAPHYTDAGLRSEMADRVLQSSHAMRGIHSAASVRAMISKEQSKQSGGAGGASGSGSQTARFGNTLYDPNAPIPVSTLPPLPPSPTNINPSTTAGAAGAAGSFAIQPPVVKVNHPPSLVRPENGLNPSLLPYLRRHPVI